MSKTKLFFKQNMKMILYFTVLAILVTYTAALRWYGNKEREEKQLYRQWYIKQHHCIVVNYVGRDAIPVHQCTTGLILDTAIKPTE